MMIHSKEKLTVISFALATLVAGGLTASRVDFVQENQSVLGGFYQKSVEADFNETFLLSKLSRDIWTAAQLLILNQSHGEVVHTKDGWLFTAEEFRQPEVTVDFAGEVASVFRTLKAANVDLIPVIVPDKARIYQDVLPHARTTELDARYDMALSELNRLGLSPLDLRLVFPDMQNNAEPFLKTDTHWTPNAASHVAAAVAQLADPDVSTGSAFATQWGDTEPFYGDLMSFVQTGHFQSILGFEPDRISRPTTTAVDTDLSLFGDMEIPVTLVGTSFSAKEVFNFDGFLKEYLGADVLNAAQVGVGPFEPMRDYLASDDFLNTPPKLIIWEIPERYISTEEFDR